MPEPIKNPAFVKALTSANVETNLLNMYIEIGKSDGKYTVGALRCSVREDIVTDGERIHEGNISSRAFPLNGEGIADIVADVERFGNEIFAAAVDPDSDVCKPAKPPVSETPVEPSVGEVG